jgi:hypothetical protein
MRWCTNVFFPLTSPTVLAPVTVRQTLLVRLLWSLAATRPGTPPQTHRPEALSPPTVATELPTEDPSGSPRSLAATATDKARRGSTNSAKCKLPSCTVAYKCQMYVSPSVSVGIGYLQSVRARMFWVGVGQIDLVDLVDPLTGIVRVG